MRLLETTLLFSADDGEHGRELWSVSTTNSPPAAGAGGPYTGPEGSAIALSGAASDPDGDELEVSWTVNSPRCSFADSSALQTTITCTDNGSYQITLTASDAFGGEDTDVAQVTVTNVPPTIQSVSGPSVTTGLVTLQVTFADPGAADTHSYEIVWGDGATSTGNVPAGARQFSVAHTYPAEGDYTVSILVADDDGGSGSDTYDVQVVAIAEPDFILHLPLITQP
jgi:PKD repeat protein